MAAVNTTVKKNRNPGPENNPDMVYFGTFGPLPIAAGNYHLWSVPPGVRFIDGYVQVDVIGGGTPGPGVLGVITDTDATTVVGATEIIFNAVAAGTAALTRWVTANVRIKVPVPPTGVEKYVLVWNREAAATTNGETITVCLSAIRDDLT